MTNDLERLKNIIDKMETASKTNRMILADKLDIKTLTNLLACIVEKDTKIERLEKMAGITESNADLIQIPNGNTLFVRCNVKGFAFDEGELYEIVKINKKQGNFSIFDNNGNKETFSFLAIINNSFSVSNSRKK
ncbi:hypothetical protein AOA01_00230 [Listeria monocytogenes]|uniref:hypothetical protein n=1 Tax=Listeria monocytogenes TaxID=1639 RepID=UPI0007757935|nr:hypothetical protein [Listeria monocytogenes]EAF5877605.1 hypothetical protein [Listeria monocytogenes]KXS65770.1 hypothetical protein AWJ02_01565 [Listeria monocytogenes]KXW92925.1 hypothetical protein AWJ00_08320 [Listeria monocytogenes]